MAGSIPAAGTSAASAPVKLKKKSATLTIKKTNKKTTYGTAKINVLYRQGAKAKKVTYKSQNKKIATVSSQGKVKAKKKGSTKITVTVRYKKGRRTKTTKFTFKVKVVLKDSRSKTQVASKPGNQTPKPGTPTPSATPGSDVPSPTPSVAPTQTTVKKTRRIWRH